MFQLIFRLKMLVKQRKKIQSNAQIQGLYDKASSGGHSINIES